MRVVSHASRASAGRSRQCQSKWAGSTRRCTRTALVTAPFSVWSVRHHPGSECACRGKAPRFQRLQLPHAGALAAKATRFLLRWLQLTGKPALSLREDLIAVRFLLELALLRSRRECIGFCLVSAKTRMALSSGNSDFCRCFLGISLHNFAFIKTFREISTAFLIAYLRFRTLERISPKGFILRSLKSPQSSIPRPVRCRRTGRV